MNNELSSAIEALRVARTIAVVGLSRHPGKSAYDIPLYMAHAGYTVIGVNPNAVGAIIGVRVVGNLDDVMEHIDILNVFRPSADTDAIIDAAIERHHRRGDINCIWLQQDITSQQGALKCTQAGITYVENACISVIQQYLNV